MSDQETPAPHEQRAAAIARLRDAVRLRHAADLSLADVAAALEEIDVLASKLQHLAEANKSMFRQVRTAHQQDLARQKIDPSAG